MDTEEKMTLLPEDQPESGQDPRPEETANSSGDQLVEELGRLGRKLIDVIETAWNSDQRRQIEQDLRNGLNGVAESLEAGLQEVGEKEQTKEVIGKAEEVADNVADKVKTSEFANELAAGLASGLHTLGDQLDRLASEIRAERPPSGTEPDSTVDGVVSDQDIPITSEEPQQPSDEG